MEVNGCVLRTFISLIANASFLQEELSYYLLQNS